MLTHIFSSLTDETIRRNWELYGHPDGRQEVSMGIALPQWIIEGKNNIWVLGLYGVLFGGVLPVLVVRSIFSDAILFGETRYGNARTVGPVVVR
jgi:translocation protein SEC63